MTIQEAIYQSLEAIGKEATSQEILDYIKNHNIYDLSNQKTPYRSISAQSGELARDPNSEVGRQKKEGNRSFFYYLTKNAKKTPGKSPSAKNQNTSRNYTKPGKTSREGLVTSRVGQGYYRDSILERWDNKCAVIGSDIHEILIASHIVPWRDSTDLERLDVDNGLLLSPVYDALFDRNLISFEENGQIVLSSSIGPESFRSLGVTGNEVIQLKLSEGNKAYLKRHRDKLKTD